MTNGNVRKKKCVLFNFFSTGSHDSFSFDLDTREGVACDESAAVKMVGQCCCGAGSKLVKRWAVTQRLNFSQQLESGIRYFDLRVAMKPGTIDCYFVHGLYGPKVIDGMRDIRKFLNNHSKEVVILDFNHFYNMNDVAHLQLLHMLKDIFQDSMIVPYDEFEAGRATLQSLWQTSRRVYIFYHNDAIKGIGGFWPAFKIPSPWPNTNKVQELIQFHDTIYHEARRGPDACFYVWQCVVTPRIGDIVRHLCGGSLEKSIHTDVCRQMIGWLKGKVAGPTALNICLGNFVETDDFIATVVDINYKTFRPNSQIEL